MKWFVKVNRNDAVRTVVTRQYWIGNMPTFSISENNESLLLNCRAKKMYEIVNIQVKYKTSNYEYRFDNTMCSMVDDEPGIKFIDS